MLRKSKGIGTNKIKRRNIVDNKDIVIGFGANPRCLGLSFRGTLEEAAAIADELRELEIESERCLSDILEKFCTGIEETPI